jgi:hypothetical protein
MKSWKARLFMGLMLVGTLLIMVAGPAMARDNHCNDLCDDRQDFRHELREDFFDNDFDCDDCDDNDDFDDFGFFPLFTSFDLDDAEVFCDNDDDDLDGLVECDDLVLVADLDIDFDDINFDDLHHFDFD